MLPVPRPASALVAAAQLLVLSLVFPCAITRAEPTREAQGAAASADYKTAIQRAVVEFEAGNYPEARAWFTRAHELQPNARTFRGLGFTAFELRNYGMCVEYLEAALASEVKPLNEAMRKESESLLARARSMIARVTMDVSPSAGLILVDGVPVQLAQGQALVLEVGDHVVEIQSPGYLPERRALSITGGEELKLSVRMRPPVEPSAERSPGAPPVESPAAQQDEPSPRRWYKSPWLWAGVALVVAGAAVGTAFLLRPDPEVRPRDPVTTDNTPPGGVVQALGRW